MSISSNGCCNSVKVTEKPSQVEEQLARLATVSKLVADVAIRLRVRVSRFLPEQMPSKPPDVIKGEDVLVPFAKDMSDITNLLNAVADDIEGLLRDLEV